MGAPSIPARIIAIGLSPAEMARASVLLDATPVAVAPQRAIDLLASPAVELVMLDLATAETLVPVLLEPSAPGTLPAPLLALYNPEQPKEAEAAQKLVGARRAHLVAKTGDYLARLPLSARSAWSAGRLVRERLARLARRIATLAGEKHRLESVEESMSEGLLVLDRDYRFATINPVARELLGVRSLEELARKLRDNELDPGLHPIFWLEAHDEQAKPVRCWEVLGCEQKACPAYGSGLFPCWLYDGTLCRGRGRGRDSFPAKLEDCSQCVVYQRNAHIDDPARARGRREVQVLHPVRKILVSLSAPIVDEEGQFLGVVKLLRDVTTERLLQQVRSEFSSFITHELRTPLTSIAGFLSLVLGGHAGDLTDAQHRQLGAAHRQAKRLERLVDNLLDISAIEAGRLELQLSHFDLIPTLVETVEMLRPQANAENIELRVEPAEEPLPVVADRERIIQMLTNLVGNAIKYTEAGGSVRVGARPGDEGVVVEVADTGRGIPPDDIPHLFDKFYRIRAEAAPGARGSGLGLAICKGIVEAHGGRIWVESAPGQGSHFLFTMPTRAKPGQADPS